ncbi:hypothetical protein [Streptomyces mirabilis]|uniref:hypothetical protein n=1 Tax=Streptomyces mirabilis TaxID=68239 RepID=UPI003646885B
MNHPTEPPPERQGAEAIPQLCCHCGELTREPVLVDQAASPSGPVDLYACPKDAPLFGENIIQPQRRAS